MTRSGFEDDNAPRDVSFGFLRRTLKKAKSGSASLDSAFWLALGRREARRRLRFRFKEYDEDGARWRSQMDAAFRRGVGYLQRAAAQGDSEAYCELGDLYQSASDWVGPKRYWSKALHWYRQAAAQNRPEAFYNIYSILEHRRHHPLALHYLRQAARRGYISALLALARRASEGDGVPKDDAEVLRLLEDIDFLYSQKPEQYAQQNEIDFLRGVALYNSAGPLLHLREAGVAMVRVAAENSHAGAKDWIENYDSYQKGGGSPMRFFAASWRNRDILASLDRTDDDILAPLDALTGLESVKDEVARMVHMGKMQALRRLNGLEPVPFSLHMAFLGAPGTGKTTAARLIGQVLKDAGLLHRGHVVEADRSLLVGEYIGQTEQKTRALLERAVGGILFIDEAYALGNKQSARDFGNDAIETILKFMEDKRGDLAVIVAGYPEPMKQFFNANPGIRSRFAHTLEFPAIKGEDAAALFRTFCAEHQYRLAADAAQSVDRHFALLSRQGALSESNGRGVRTLFEQVMARQARRVVRNRLHTKDDIVRIQIEDLPWDTGRDRLRVVTDADRD